MIKRVFTFLLITTFILAAGSVFAENNEIPARLQTEVIKLRHISFTKPIEETIKTIIDTDYSGKAFFTYDKKNRAIIVTATNVTIDRIKKFINKFDIKGTPLVLKVYVLTEKKGKNERNNLPKTLTEKLKKLDIYSVETLSSAMITTKTGKSVFVSLKDPNYGTAFEITFFLTEEDGRIGLYDFNIYKLTKKKDNVYNKWKIIHSSYSITPEDPLVIGITGDNKVDYIFAVTMTK